jgi:hypothetical protein
MAAGPAGGFIFGLLNAGDPDPNPVGRFFYACMMAVQTPLHAGFPPRVEAQADHAFKVLPHIALSYVFHFEYNGRDFKIRNVPASVITRFSKRHQQIDEESEKPIEREGGDAHADGASLRT